ncbi:hypothetical protein [Curvivirga aplysinae]|uniref:hypothetical protein n=1 Tax=Curvivirga aplysinae TaxID=2529852 RepID=UPI0012BCC3F6|nr:hypothetical protein [Curvivirga aplysinae]MTI10519.1 hypothetical protein [Curvivirga aplysinae]
MSEQKLDYELTDEEIRVATEYLYDLGWIERDCEVCQSREWVMGRKLLGMLPTDGKGSFSVTPDYAYVAIICEHCGNTKMANANVLGFRDFSESEEGGNE